MKYLSVLCVICIATLCWGKNDFSPKTNCVSTRLIPEPLGTTSHVWFRSTVNGIIVEDTKTNNKWIVSGTPIAGSHIAYSCACGRCVNNSISGFSDTNYVTLSGTNTWNFAGDFRITIIAKSPWTDNKFMVNNGYDGNNQGYGIRSRTNSGNVVTLAIRTSTFIGDTSKAPALDNQINIISIWVYLSGDHWYVTAKQGLSTSVTTDIGINPYTFNSGHPVIGQANYSGNTHVWPGDIFEILVVAETATEDSITILHRNLLAKLRSQ